MLSRTLWKDLEDGKQEVGEQIKRSEFDILKSYSKKLILDKLGQVTVLGNVVKNHLGYCLYRYCENYHKEYNEKYCESKFKVNLNIHSHRTTLFFNKLCCHK